MLAQADGSLTTAVAIKGSAGICNDNRLYMVVRVSSIGFRESISVRISVSARESVRHRVVSRAEVRSRSDVTGNTKDVNLSD
jgi:hypothetical protein